MIENPHGEAYYGGNIFGDAHITIIGLGAVGSWLALSLAKQNAKLSIIDFDSVNARNLGTTPFSDMDLGLRKAEAMANLTYPNTEKFKVWTVTADNISGTVNAKTDLLIDCTDNAESRNMLQANSPVPVLHVGINDNWGSVTWGEHFTKAAQPEQEDACEVPYSLNLIFPVVGLTIDMLAKFYLGGVKESFGFDLVTGQKVSINKS